jgi:hypothetical protein
LKVSGRRQSAQHTPKTEANATLNKAAAYQGWNGPSYTFALYVEVYQEAFNELANLREPIPKSKKVTNFLAGISDPILTQAKQDR